MYYKVSLINITLALQVIERGEQDLSTTQMLKGILDGCLLAIIKNKEVYGYELAEKLESYGFHSFSEGTIYPLLMRMQKEELVTSTLKKSTAGPRRKYYSLTPKGEAELEMFIKRWNDLQTNVNRILRQESDTKYSKGDETVE
jgi:PadR family transcriptional regulator PadR